MRKLLKNKNILSALILALMLFVSVLSCVLITSRPLKDNGSTNLNLLNSGKSELYLNVKDDVLPFQSEKECKEYFQDYFKLLNGCLGDEDKDFLKLESVNKTAQGYRVKVSTWRIDKIGGLGLIAYGTGKHFSDLAGSLLNVKVLREYTQGIFRPTVLRAKPEQGTENVQFLKSDNSVVINPQTAKGKTVVFGKFENYLEKTSDKIAVVNLIDLDFVEKITINVNGKIKYCSSEHLRVVDKDTVEITPIEMKAMDGSTKRCFVAYITFEENIATLPLCLIVAGVEVLLWFVLSGFLLGWFQAFFHSALFRKMMRYKTLYVLLLPGLAFLIIFHYAPMVGLSAAFQDYKLLEGTSSEWIGGMWFKRIFTAAHTTYVYRVFRNTIFISLLRITTNFPIIVIFALFINGIKNKALKSVVQTVSFIPYFLSWAAISELLYAIISDYGLLNSVIVKMGGSRMSLYVQNDAWWGILSASSLWKGMGWSTLIYISAMCNIDGELYEACALDGGGSVRQMITVTIPGIMPMICLQLVLDSSSIMKDNYEQILALTNGTTALEERLMVIGQVTMNAVSKGSGFGSATAYGLIQGVIGLLLVYITNSIVKKTDNPGIV